MKKLKFLILPSKVLLAISILSLILNYLLSETSIFIIDNVSITGTNGFVNSNDFRKVAEASAVGTQIFRLNTTIMSDELAVSFQGAKFISVSKKYPRSISINVVERIPLVVIISKENNFLVDDAGYVLGEIDISTTNLPKISYKGELKVGYFIDKKMVPVYLELLTSLDEYSVKVSSISANATGISFYTASDVEVLLGTKKDIKTSVALISRLIKQLVEAGKDPRRIDLRYDKVIVSYE